MPRVLFSSVSVPSRRAVLIGAASAAGLAAAAYISTVSPLVVVGTAIGIVSVAMTKLILKKQQMETLDIASREAVQLFAAALAAAQKENQASVLPEHDMRTDAASVVKNEAQSQPAQPEKDTETRYRIRVTHPNASSMVH